MITETLLNSLKSLFSSLGAKTSDNNYAVGLFDKTSGEPKGLMGMENLASVLGVYNYTQNLKYLDTTVAANQYIKIDVRTSYIDVQWQKKGIGEANFILQYAEGSFGYDWGCCKIEYPFTGVHTGEKTVFYNLNGAQLFISEIKKAKLSDDTDNFFATLLIKIKQNCRVKGWFEAYSVSIVSNVDESTIYSTYTNISTGVNEF